MEQPPYTCLLCRRGFEAKQFFKTWQRFVCVFCEIILIKEADVHQDEDTGDR